MMKFSLRLTLTLLTLAIGVAAPNLSEASGFKFYGQTSFFSKSNESACEKSVKSINELAGDMASLYAKEKKTGCSDCDALYRQIVKHKLLTANLVKAFKTNKQPAMKAAANEVNASLRLLNTLKSRAQVSRKLNDMILKTTPLMTRIKTCAGN